MNFKEAAYKLKMTVALLKWFSHHSAKNDGRKLIVGQDGEITEDGVNSFNEYLWAPWENRYVPAGIAEELRREARGQCGCCGDHSAELDEAHIKRKDIELDYYVQHPHNLILLCGRCHPRYDKKHDKEITIKVIEHCKQLLLSRMLEDVKRDVEIATCVRTTMEDIKSFLSKSMTTHGLPPIQVWSQKATDIYSSAIVGSGVAAQSPIAALMQPTDSDTLRESLFDISGSLVFSHPVTSAVIDGYANEVGVKVDPTPDTDEWGWVSQREVGECERCGNDAMLESADCANCGNMSYEIHGEEMYTVEEADDGSIKILTIDANGSYSSVQCENCGSDHFSEVEYQSCCSYCQHMWEKLDEE